MFRAIPRIVLYVLIFLAVLFVLRFFRRRAVDRQERRGPGQPPRPGDDAIDVTYKVTDAKVLGPCPVCREPVKGASHICPECDAAHHAECWKLNDGCGACDHG